MQYIFLAIESWLVLLVFGFPLALILLPRELRRMALPAAPLFGYAYIVFIGYQLFRLNIGGTDTYAIYLLIIPFITFLWVCYRRELSTEVLFSRHAMLMTGLAILSFAAISSLFVLANGRAVSMALSNHDIGELASVSRYMQELARDSKIGFLGQSTQFLDTGDYIWFGPSMIVAVTSSLIFSEPFRLQSMVLSLIAAQGTVYVYAISRDTLSYNRPVALAIALLYAANPVVTYTFWQFFGAQMISMPIMLFVIYLVLHAQNQPSEVRIQARYLPCVVLMFSALFVTYHFMIAIIVALLGCYIAVFALVERSARRFIVGGLVVFAAVVLTAVLNPLRTAVISQTFKFLSEGTNGWFIPWLSPDIQVGFNAIRLLLGDGSVYFGTLPGKAVVILLALTALVPLLRSDRRPAHVAFVVGLALPAVFLGLFYAVREAQDGILGSYRSFKITSTFVALTLIALGLWFGTRPISRHRVVSVLGGLLIIFLLVQNLAQLRAMVRFSAKHSYVPSEELTKIRKIESMDFVSGMYVMDNVMKGSFFDLFWIEYFSLRKRLAFQSFPYGGRVVGELTEPYRLQRNSKTIGPGPSDSIFSVQSVECDEHYPITDWISLCKAKQNYDVTITPGEGWWGPEPGRRWSGRNGRFADVVIYNRVPGTRVRLKAVYANIPSTNSIMLTVNDKPVTVNATSTELISAPIELQAGRQIARFTMAFDPSPPTSWDGRTLGVLWKHVLVEFPDLSDEPPPNAQ